MVTLAVAFAVVLILHEEVLVGAVSGEENGGRAEARQRALEAVEACERALETPGITTKTEQVSNYRKILSIGPIEVRDVWEKKKDVRSLPGVVARSSSSLLEVTHVEAGDVGLAAGGS